MRKFLVTVNGGSYEVVVEEIGGVAPVAAAPAPQAAPAPVAPAPVPVAPAPAPTPAAEAPAPAAPQAPIAGGRKVTSPMPGTILGVNVQVGQTVKGGDILVVLEAMKMENEIPSPVDGKVLQVAVSKGATVNTGDVLVVLG